MYEMDLLNEEVHQPKYWSNYGAAGIADIFNEAAAAVTGAGANTRLALNEYNVLQFGSDAYGNWFRHDIESVANAGGAISAIGVQYYPTQASGSNDHSPSRITQTFENLAVTGLPISLTEFGVQANNGSVERRCSDASGRFPVLDGHDAAHVRQPGCDDVRHVGILGQRHMEPGAVRRR